MDGFIDIHTHLLPGVDDGASDVQEALKLVRLAYQNGTRTIVLTPHYRGKFRKNSPDRFCAVFAEFSKAVQQEMPKMKLYLGSEAYYEQALPMRLTEGSVLTINNSRYCLLEFSPGVLRSQVVAGVSEIIRYGFLPIVAHVERYDVFRKSRDLLDDVLDMGALIQVNADSIMGKHGLLIKLFCNDLLKNGKVHFVATDAHDEKNRPPVLRDCFLHIHKKYGADYAKQLFYDNARTVLAGEQL